MKCPECGGIDIGVLDTRDAPYNRVRRRRYCVPCRTRWTTFEISKEDLDGLLKLRRNKHKIRDALTGLVHMLDN